MGIKVKAAVWATEKRLLIRQIEALQSQIKDLHAKIAQKQVLLGFMAKVEQASVGKRFPLRRHETTLSSAIREASKILQKFSKRDLEKHLREHYPGLRFKFKSFDQPLVDMVKGGGLRLVQQGGGKIPGPNIYELGTSETSA